MRILIFAISPHYGGAEAYTVKVSAELKKLGHEVKVVTQKGSKMIDYLAQAEIKVVTTAVGPKLSSKSVIKTILNWKNYLREFEDLLDLNPSDAVIIQFKLESLLIASIPSRNFQLLILEHGPIARKFTMLEPVRKKLVKTYSQASARLAVSKEAALAFQSLGLSAIEIGAGVDSNIPVQIIESKPPAVPPQSFLYLGRLEKSKGVPKLLKLFKKLSGERVFLTVGGLGRMMATVKRAASKLENLNYLGYVDKSDLDITNFDAGILLSKREGKPLFALECIAANRPVYGLTNNRALAQLQSEFGSRAVILAENLELLKRVILGQKATFQRESEVETWKQIAERILGEIR